MHDSLARELRTSHSATEVDIESIASLTCSLLIICQYNVSCFVIMPVLQCSNYNKIRYN